VADGETGTERSALGPLLQRRAAPRRPLENLNLGKIMKPNSPAEEDIAQRARELWLDRGQPTGQDTPIWLEAERQLKTTVAATNTPSPTEGRGNSNTQSSQTPVDPKPADLKPGASAQTERLRDEMASESEVEFQITPAQSVDEDIQAALQKQDARAPQQPAKAGPPVKPPETGQPVWPKPHSS
jgi:hypothetical protein